MKNWTLEAEENGYKKMTHTPILLNEQTYDYVKNDSERDQVRKLTDLLFKENDYEIFDLETGHLEKSFGEPVFYPPVCYRMA